MDSKKFYREWFGYSPKEDASLLACGFAEAYANHKMEQFTKEIVSLAKDEG